MRIIFIFLVILSSHGLTGQNETQLEGSVLGINFHYGVQLPGGDLADRFGLNFYAGTSVDYITKKLYIIGVEGGFLFGNKVKENVISNLSNDGTLIGNSRSLANYGLRERGLYFGSVFGKIFPLGGKNKRSGLRTTFGIGLLQHKIRLQQDPDSKVLQFSGEYRKGYDRLSNGLTFTQFIGYQHLSDNRMLNFFIGIEFTEAFTKNRRSYNYNEMQQDTKSRKDFLYGIKVGWTLPIYFGENPEEIFY